MIRPGAWAAAFVCPTARLAPSMWKTAGLPSARMRAWSAAAAAAAAFAKRAPLCKTSWTGPEGTGVSGRGTEEMKTNDVTGRFRPGWVGVAVEMGRPVAGCTFRQVQSAAVELASTGLVEFEPCNPITSLMLDNKTGYFREEILDERVYSAILEFSVQLEKLPAVLALCKRAAEKTETLFSLDVCSVTQDGQDRRVLEILALAGMRARPNGKVNLGLGKPACVF